MKRDITTAKVRKGKNPSCSFHHSGPKKIHLGFLSSGCKLSSHNVKAALSSWSWRVLKAEPCKVAGLTAWMHLSKLVVNWWKRRNYSLESRSNGSLSNLKNVQPRAVFWIGMDKKTGCPDALQTKNFCHFFLTKTRRVKQNSFTQLRRWWGVLTFAWTSKNEENICQKPASVSCQEVIWYTHWWSGTD